MLVWDSWERKDVARKQRQRQKRGALRADETWRVSAWSSPSITLPLQVLLLPRVFCFFFFSVPCWCHCCQISLCQDRQENELENICSDLFLLECELADGRMIGYFKLPMLWNFKHTSGAYGWEAGWEQMLLLLCKKKSMNSTPSLIEMLIQLG